MFFFINEIIFLLFYQLNQYQARTDFITPLPNPSIQNIPKIDILFASNNMHRMCVTAPAILQGANA